MPQVIVLDMDISDVVVQSRDTELMPTPQPPSEWSDNIPLSKFTGSVGLTLMMATLSLMPNEPFNNITSIVVSRNVVVNGTPVRTVDYRISRA